MEWFARGAGAPSKETTVGDGDCVGRSGERPNAPDRSASWLRARAQLPGFLPVVVHGRGAPRRISRFLAIRSSHVPCQRPSMSRMIRHKGVSIAGALENLLVITGGDVRADGTFERVAEDFSNRCVTNRRGEMVPYRSARSCSSR
jgi:hypothetical protein